MYFSSRGTHLETKRRVWDREEYRRKAERREEEASIKTTKSKCLCGFGVSLLIEPIEKRKDLEARDTRLDLDENVGKTVVCLWIACHYADVQVIGAKGQLPKNLGFYCEVCDVTMKDSASYIGHMNGKNRIVAFSRGS